MQVLVFSSSPNTDGLTAACAAAAIEGCRSGGAEAEEVRLNDLDIGSCRACDQGWGTCGEKHYCQVEDGFQAIHSRTKEANAYIFVNPVYFGEMSESMKRFGDRLRRCEAGLQENSRLAGKWTIAVAAAGGGGGGLVYCLGSLERFFQHVKLKRYDLITITRWTREQKLKTIRSAAEAMVRAAEYENTG